MGKTNYVTSDEALPEDLTVESLDRTYLVTFTQNRSTELRVGRKTFFFGPYESNVLTKMEIEHPDFKQQAGSFTIKEI